MYSSAECVYELQQNRQNTSANLRMKTTAASLMPLMKCFVLSFTNKMPKHFLVVTTRFLSGGTHEKAATFKVLTWQLTLKRKYVYKITDRLSRACAYWYNDGGSLQLRGPQGKATQWKVFTKLSGDLGIYIIYSSNTSDVLVLVTYKIIAKFCVKHVKMVLTNSDHSVHYSVSRNLFYLPIFLS